MAAKPLRLPTAQTSAAASGPRESLSKPPRSTSAPLCGQCTGFLCESVACCPLWVDSGPRCPVVAVASPGCLDPDASPAATDPPLARNGESRNSSESVRTAPQSARPHRSHGCMAPAGGAGVHPLRWGAPQRSDGGGVLSRGPQGLVPLFVSAESAKRAELAAL